MSGRRSEDHTPGPTLANANASPPVRQATEDDVPRLVDLIELLAKHHGDHATVTEETLRSDLFGPIPWGIALVADHGHEVVGYALLVRLYRAQFSKRVIDLHHLFVMPEARRLGVGTALVQATINEAEKQGCRQVVVGTNPANLVAQAFYVRSGFSQTSSLGGPKFKLRISN